ncbi:MAG: high-affinity nickel-transport family protein [Betaproteobacteria bacterium]|nr:high-affinity nickel-transport family protein [Betaproteobacteria bacterium]
MTAFFSLLAFGFFLGMRHATDADHVIAVSTIVSRERNLKWAALIGALWGVGHTVTVLAVGGAIILFGVVIPPKVGLAMEFAVAVMLVILGLFTLSSVTQSIREQVAYTLAGQHPHGHGGDGHLHTHVHGDYVHAHSHGHGSANHGHAEDDTPQAKLDKKLGGLKPYLLIRPMIVGVVHGLAGSAAVALLVLAAIRDPAWAVGYLAIFGLGTVAGMMLITSLIAAPMVYASRLPNLNIFMRLASGVLSLGFGLYLIFQIGWVDGLFAGQVALVPVTVGGPRG